jgi:hypothetical protein
VRDRYKIAVHAPRDGDEPDHQAAIDLYLNSVIMPVTM